MTDDQIVKEARRRFALAAEAESQIRLEALEDLKFWAGEQWPQDAQNARRMDQRPCLTINRLPQFTRQVTNEQRQNRPAIKIDPVDDGTDIETAEIMQGLCRHIEVSSDADVAYDTGFEYMTKIGFGYWRVVTDYDGEGFNQCIKIKRIKNPFSVYMDPSAQEVDRSDARWCFVVEDYSREDFAQEWPKAKATGLSDFQSIGDGEEAWFADGKIRVAEYFRVVEDVVTLSLLPDGSIVEGEDVEAVRKRRATIRRVEWYKINGLEVLEKGETAGRYIPIVGVYGDEIDIDGRKMLFGMVRFARDPVRMYNYWVSAATETIALAPRSPFIGVAGQFDGFERQWQTANTRNWPYLEYKDVSVAGKPVPPPQRNIYEPPVQAIMSAIVQSDNDLKAVTGIYDASLGERGAQESGRAILARQRESDVANLNYVDNMKRAIRHTARIVVDLIPKIYDAPRVVRILKPDGGDAKIVPINQPTIEKGVQRMYDMTTGKYDITVDVGPSYNTKRQEAVASMVELTKTYPAIMQVAGDLLVKNMDWPGAQEIAERLKRTLPPGVADEEGKAPIPPQAKAAMDQMAEQIKVMSQIIDDLTSTIETKRMDLDSKERIAAMNADVKLVDIMDRSASSGAKVIMDHEFRQAQQQIDAVAAPNEPGKDANA